MFFEGWDPSLYGMTRMLFGMLMAMDCFVERGLHYADAKWFDDGCKGIVSYFLINKDTGSLQMSLSFGL